MDKKIEMIETTVESHEIFEGKVVHLFVDDIIDCYGNKSKREIVKHPGGVCILAFDDDDNIMFVEQYRYAISKTLVELPAGKLEYGENPLECGKRELIEETGYKANKFEEIGTAYLSPGFSGEIIHLYRASDLEFVGQNFDDSEYVECTKMKFDEAVEKIMSGEITDGKTQVAILKEYVLRQKRSTK